MANWSIGICMLAKANAHGQRVLSEIVMDIGKMIDGKTRGNCRRNSSGFDIKTTFVEIYVDKKASNGERTHRLCGLLARVH
ncbi:hypothetical protein CHELA1G11_20975 [Hyphomicrobiales bacterium]|nr:hypothetical protein CHELA1G11_20975 [Hyphomicrobiales bacterium]CAH1692818.1 hypothetical protein CHELA1G2_21291 [Hyphomicrobiales bacterium]